MAASTGHSYDNFVDRFYQCVDVGWTITIETVSRSQTIVGILGKSGCRRRNLVSCHSEIYIFTRLLLASPRQHLVLSGKKLSKLIAVLRFDYKGKAVSVYA